MNENKTKAALLAELEQAQKRIAELEVTANRENEERFATVFRASPSQMALTDVVTGQYVDVNEAFLRILGFTREEVIGKTALELEIFVNAAQRAELLQRMVTQACLRNEHVLIRAQTGEIRHGIFSAEFIHVNGQKLLLTVMNDVTERMQAEERWQFALEGAGDGVWDLNTQTKQAFYSCQWKAILGYAENEIGSSPDEWLSRVHPDDLPRVMEKVHQHMGKESPNYQSEHRLRCKDGSYKWVLSSGKVIEWTADDKPLRIIGTHKDISERKLAEEKLRASEEHHRALVETLDISLCRWLPDTTLTYVNGKYKQLFGSKGEIGQKWLNQLPEEARPTARAFYGEVAENPRSVIYENPVTVEDGSVCQYQWIDTPILDEHGKVLEFQSVGLDITEKKNAEKALLESEARLKGFLDATPDAMVIINAEGQILMVNAQAERMFGYTQSELLDVDLQSLMPLRFRSQHALNCAKFMTHAHFENTNIRDIFALRKNGDEFPVEISLSHHIMTNDETVVLGAIRDVTEQKRTEALIAAQRDLARLTSANLTNAEMWQACFQVAERISGLDSGGLYFLNEHSHAFELVYHHGLGVDFINMVAQLAEEAPSGQMFLSGKTFYFTEADLEAYKYYAAEGIHAFAALPIRHHDNVLGYLNLASHTLRSIPAYLHGALEIVAAELGNLLAHQATEEALRTSRAQLNQALIAARMGTWRWDISTNHTEWSPEAAHIFGIAIGQDDFEAVLARVHLDDQEMVADELQKVLAQKRFSNMEFRIFDDAGHTLWITNYGHIECDPEGNPVAIVGLMQDITAHKLAEVKLRESEERFRSFIEQSVDGFMLVDEAGFIIEWNQANTEITGLPREQVLGMTMWELQFLLSTPEMRSTLHVDALKNILTEMLQNRHSPFFEHANEAEIQTAKGQRRIIQQTSFPIRTALGYRIGAVVRDVTEFMQMEAKLRDSDKLHRRAMEVAGAVPYYESYSDEGKKITYNFVGEGIRQITGYGPEEFSSELWDSLVEEVHLIEDLEGYSLEEGIDKIRAGEVSTWKCEYRIRARDGSQHWVLEAAVELWDAKGVLSGSIGTYQDITARKLAEATIQASEEKYHGIFDNSVTAIYVFDQEKHFIDSNQAGLELLGYTYAELMQLSIPDVDADPVVVLPAHAELLAGGRLINYEHKLRRKDGATITVLNNSIPLTDASGNVTGMLSTLLDITERQRAEENLRASEERYRLLVEQSPDAIMIDQGGKILYINPAGVKIAGASQPQELLGKTTLGLIHPDYRKKVLTAIRESLQKNGQIPPTEAAILRLDGALLDVEMSSTQITYQGKPARQITCRDISAHKRAEELLRLQSAALDASANAIVITSLEGIIQWANPAFSHLTGYTLQEAFGKSPRDLIKSGKQGKEFYADLWNTVLRGGIWRGELINRRKDGSLYDEEMTITPIRDAQGISTHLIAIKQEITERKQVEVQLRESEKKYRDLINGMNDTIWVIDFDTTILDVNTAATTVLGYSREELLSMKIPDIDMDLTPQQVQGLAVNMPKDKIQVFETWHRTKDGRKLPVEVSSSLVSYMGRTVIMSIARDITEHKQADAQRRKAQEDLQRERYLLRILIDNLPDLVFMKDRQSRFLVANQATARFMGTDSPKQIIGHTDFDFYPQELAAQYYAVEQQIMETGENIVGWERAQDDLAQNQRWLSATKIALYDQERQVNGLVGIERDLTERRQAEEALRSSEARFATIFRSSPNAIAVSRLSDNIMIDVNNAWENITGWSRQDVIGKSPLELNLWVDPDERKRLKRLVVELGAVHGFEMQMRSRSGTILNMLMSAEIITLQDEPCLLSMTQDITERKQTEEELRASEEKFSKAFLASPDAIVISDLESSRYLEVNDSFLQETGYERSEIIGFTAMEKDIWAKPQDRARLVAELKAHGFVRNLEAQYRHKAGWVRDALVSAEIIELEQGKKHLLTVVRDITERKQAEEALRKSQANLEMAQAIAHLGSWEESQDDEGVHWSKEMFALFDCDPTQPVRAFPEFMEMIHPEDRAWLLSEQQRAADTQSLVTFEFRSNPQRGKGRYYQATVRSSPQVAGKPARFSGTVLDITDLKLAYEQLSESEAKYRLLAENISDVIWVMDATSRRFRYISPSVVQLLGYSLEELLARDAFSVLPPGSMEYIAGIWGKRLEEFQHGLIKTYTDEVEHLRKDGSIIWVELSTHYLLNANTGQVEVYGVTHNITERKLAQDELARTEKRSRALIENAPDGIVLIDIEGRFKYASPSVERIFGYLQKDLPYCDSANMTYPEDLPRVLAELGKLIENPAYSPTIQYRFRHKNGQWRWIESTFSNLLATPSIVGIIINFRDIHERKLSEEALNRSQELLEEAQRIGRIGYMEWNGKDPVLICSEEVYEILGLPRDIPITQKTVAALMTPVERERVQQLDGQAIQARRDMDYEFSIHKPDGSEHWLHQIVKVTYAENGSPSRTMAIIQDVTERKQAEVSLRESRSRIEMALRGANAGMWDWNIQTGAAVFNDRWAEMLGYTLQELEPISIQTRANLCHPDDLKISDKLLQKHFAGETEYYECEARMKHKNGAWIWVIDRGKVMEWDAAGKPVRMFGTHLDITERKREERYTQARLCLANLSYELLDMDTLMRTMLDEAEALTDSTIGFFHFVDDDQNTISLQTWSTNTLATMCTAEGKGQHYPVGQAGVWADGVRDGEPHIYNNYPGLPQRRELPKGHAPVTRMISLPIKRNNLVVAAIGVGNKPRDYDEHDLGMVKRLAEDAFDIVLRKRAEQALRESERKLSTLLSNLIGFAYRCQNDRSWTMEYLSGGCQAITGYPPEDFIGNQALAYNDLILPADQEMVWNTIQNALELKAPYQIEYRLINRQGSEKWVWEQGRGIFENGTFKGLEGYITDITDRKRVGQALRSSEEKYRGLMESLDNAVYTVDFNGKFIYMNDMAAGKLGGEPQDLIGKNLKELFTESAASTQLAIIQNIFRTDRESLFEAQSLGRGNPRWHRFALQPLHNEAGKVVQVLVNATDIHDLKTAQQDLQELNRTLEERVRERTAQVQDLYDNAPVGYHSIDIHRQFTAINQTELTMLGYTREELLGQPNSIAFAPESAQALADNFMRLLADGQIVDLEVMAKRKDGSTFPVMINAVAVYDENGQFISSRSTMTDITERQRAEETLRHANVELARAMRMKDEFLANMSHELRTPLNGILGLSEALQLQTYGLLSEKQLRATRNIESSGRHLLSLINDILDLSKIEAGKLEIHPEPVPVADICQASLAFIKEPAIKKGLAVEFVPDPLVTMLNADLRRLKQILVNLLSNAVKFTPSGGRVTLKVQADLQQNMADFAVIDTGIGIAPKDLARLFNPFTQVDSSLTRQHEGTGLGLALVKELTEMHGGSIRVSSEVGMGSIFTVSIPWQPDPAAQEMLLASDSVEPGQVTAQEIPKPLGKILLAEDVELNIMTIGDFLESQGYNMIYALNGHEAIEKAREYLPDVILMDVQMPEMDGLEATRRLRADPRFATVPIIALTAMAMSGDRDRCLEAGATDYVSKPVSLKELLELIRMLLGK